jgi:hypothetical protein
MLHPVRPAKSIKATGTRMISFFICPPGLGVL